jgi:hypothetical protein
MYTTSVDIIVTIYGNKMVQIGARAFSFYLFVLAALADKIGPSMENKRIYSQYSWNYTKVPWLF